jgi:hypothetical protein
MTLTDRGQHAVAAVLANRQNITKEEALARVDHVEQHGKESPYALDTLRAASEVLRPILHELEVAMASADPTSPEAVVPVIAVIEAVMPEREET